MWKSASIPTVTKKQIVNLITNYNNKWKGLLKTPKAKQESDNSKQKLRTFQNKANAKLFDIAACKCVRFDQCNCPKDRKVPLKSKLNAISY